jgi:dienelactone hydrolase
MLVGVLALTFAATAAPAAPAPGAITVHAAGTHPMRYHLALPEGWSADRTWPVIVAIPDAGRQFEPNLREFVAARGGRPYILVAPEVLSCGGARTRTLDHYSYSPAVWDSIQRIDDFTFDEGGVAAVLADVRRQWHGEPAAFLTGWEAGGHTVWALAFRRPELWRGVAPVSTNYQRRGLAAAAFSAAPERTRLPIQVFREATPPPADTQLMTFLDEQTAMALADARAHGYAPAPVRAVPGGVHGPLAAAVVAWCDSVVQHPRPH